MFVRLCALVFSLMFATSAFAQGGPIIPDDSTTYTIRYLAFAPAEEVCFFEVTNPNPGPSDFVDSNEDGTVDKADAFHCTTSFNPDGTTVNQSIVVFSPARVDDFFGAALSYRIIVDEDGTETILESVKSNIKAFLVQPKPVRILGTHESP